MRNGPKSNTRTRIAASPEIGTVSAESVCSEITSAGEGVGVIQAVARRATHVTLVL
jgi:hypothetical protein